VRDDEAPEGYHYEWVPEGVDWKVGGDGCKCRRLRCPNRAVAALLRNQRNPSRLPGAPMYIRVWWHYCADHLYGRKIENGVVLSQRLVENEVTA
jgi:hypothetical protein